MRNDSDPTPDIYFGDEIEDHGTSCAGEIGMAKSNDHCGAGVAYDCNLGGLKIDLSSLSDLQTADALGYNNSYIGIYSNSWGPLDFGFIVEGPGQLTSMTLANGALRVRTCDKLLLLGIHDKLYIGTRWQGEHLCLGCWQWWRIL